MPTSSATGVESEFADFRRAFDGVFEPAKPSRMFGNVRRRHQGFSDDHEGVQRNAGVDRERGVVTVGVNLEGMAYRDWPIARFIEAEQRSPLLPSLVQGDQHTGQMELWFTRDAWQFASRFEIREQYFGPEPPLLLSILSVERWRTMLAEAYACLDSVKGHRGRGRQVVTLSTGPKEMTVSPHLQIKAVVRRSVDLHGLDGAFASAKALLLPVRELVQRQAGA